MIIQKDVRVITIDELVSRYALSNEADGKSPSTVKWYTEILSSFSSYVKNGRVKQNLSALTLELAREYVLYVRQRPRFQGHPYTPERNKPISPKTVQCHVRTLKAFASWLYAESYTSENILRNLKIPKAPVTIIEPLVPEEIKKITASIDKNSFTGSRNNTIFTTLLDTGLRASEAAGITLNNLNLSEGYIKVMGKGSRERIVPIGKYIQMTLWTYVDKVRPEPVYQACNYLFLTRGGEPITVNTIKLIFSRLARNSGVKKLHAHLCRHTFAINYLLNGGDIFSLREILGHTTLDMVNHYLHFTSSQITDQHHKFSPMDRLQEVEKQSKNRQPVLSSSR